MPPTFILSAARLLILWCGLLSFRAIAAEAPVHGLWLWKTTSVLEMPGSADELAGFCKTEGINEVYVSIPGKINEVDDGRIGALIELLHRSKVRVEALFGSADADLPGKPREHLLEQVRGVLQFNEQHPAGRFDGIHLDIEPHQRPENKGAGNLKFLPGLVETFRQVRTIAGPAGLTVNADIANKFLKGDASERRMMLTSVDRVTLMMYELSSPSDGKDAAAKMEKMRKAGERYLAMTYEGLSEPNLAKMAIALRTPDYLELLPSMLQGLDTAFRDNPHYLGWARHSYNDVAETNR